MPLKSTQTNPYETACFIQEAPISSELSPKGYKVKKSSTGLPFCVFDATLQTFNCYNRMGRRYDAQNLVSVIESDERIQTLKKQNKWRGELNHPNPDIIRSSGHGSERINRAARRGLMKTISRSH